ncbi:MAG: hypothetical protein IH987_07575 [Planctomycetes bacterium]|nr:hypothetical protein [Planctomycetota bacterium]
MILAKQASGPTTCCTITALGWAVLSVMTPPTRAQDPMRDLSAYSNPVTVFSVQITVDTPLRTVTAVMEESPPTNWSVSNISHSGTWDEQSQKVKWGPFFSSSIPPTVSYDVTPAGAGSERCFDGTISFDAVDETIGGDLCVGDPIPAISHWGLACMTLLVLTASSILLGHGRPCRKRWKACIG